MATSRSEFFDLSGEKSITRKTRPKKLGSEFQVVGVRPNVADNLRMVDFSTVDEIERVALATFDFEDQLAFSPQATQSTNGG